MSDQPRPGQPSLRYLKLEARHRLAAGEFGALHDAQLAIARSLIVKAGDGRAYVALTNRKAPQVAALNIRVFLNGS
jgi:hypothetical protein